MAGPSSVVLLKKVLVEFGAGDSKDAFEVSFSSQEDKSDLKALQEVLTVIQSTVQTLAGNRCSFFLSPILPNDNKEWGGREVNIKGMDVIEDWLL